MARYTGLRASDADRESVAERLRNATAEGRLLASELEERLERAFSARTYGELEGIVDDLPRERSRRGARRRSPLAGLALAVVVACVVVAAIAVAVMVITGLLATWAVWALVAWWFFGRRRGRACRGTLGGD